jgi:signal transduction histidine kinase
MAVDSLAKLQIENSDLHRQVAQLTALNRLWLRLGTGQDFQLFLDELLAASLEFIGCDTTVILLPDDEDLTLFPAAYRLPAAAKQQRQPLSDIRFSLYGNDPGSLIDCWKRGECVLADESSASLPIFDLLTESFGISHFLGCPFRVDDNLIGALLVANVLTQQPITQEQIQAAELLTGNLAPALANARQHQKTSRQLAANMRELHILRQIDRELTDTIDLHHVFEMTLDWALRFTNAQASSLALYDQDTNKLNFLLDYGYDVPGEELERIRQEYGSGIVLRVANSGHAEVVPDIHMDKDYVGLSVHTLSQMAVPVMREDRVVAVITLESKKLNGFTDAHLDFVQKLANRAGVAIDNARLYEKAIWEREKLSHILNNTADVVILIDFDDRIMLINQSALGALQLYANQDYIGVSASEALAHTPVFSAFQRARRQGDTLTEEVMLPNERIFHANFRRFEGIGWILVMHDITPFREMDKLKSELIATVSHDLKQPLSVMNGYIELMLMQQAVTPQGMNSVQMIRRAMQNMRQLVDDLLDLTKIESGIKLDLRPTPLQTVINECLEQIRPGADGKSMQLLSQVPEDLPPVMADRGRLRQIMINLVGNAVKYTPAQGWARIWAEPRGDAIRIAVQDNGLGISPEDQIHIFERFYRVRRPETDTIEGTGLGLAIVKSLVEAHHGQITLESRLGEGSTFYLTLPLARTDAA